MTSDLILTATSLDPAARAAAIRALGETRRVDGIQALLFALATADPATADLAVDALARIGEAATPSLKAALDQEVDPTVHNHLQTTLTHIQQAS